MKSTQQCNLCKHQSLHCAQGGSAICHTELCPGGPASNVGQSAGGIFFFNFNYLFMYLILATEAQSGPSLAD